MTFAQSLLLTLEIFFFLAYLMVLFHIFGDLFRDRELGGLAKAVWVILLIVFPLLGSLVYLIARGNGMTKRTLAAREKSVEATQTFIRETAGRNPAQEIATAKSLLDAGAVTPAEYELLKADALAAAPGSTPSAS